MDVPGLVGLGKQISELDLRCLLISPEGREWFVPAPTEEEQDEEEDEKPAEDVDDEDFLVPPLPESSALLEPELTWAEFLTLFKMPKVNGVLLIPLLRRDMNVSLWLAAGVEGDRYLQLREVSFGQFAGLDDRKPQAVNVKRIYSAMLIATLGNLVDHMTIGVVLREKELKAGISESAKCGIAE